MSDSVTEFANLMTEAETSTFDQVDIFGLTYEPISVPYTDPSTSVTTLAKETIPIPGLVAITDTTSNGMVLPLATLSTVDTNQFNETIDLSVLGTNILTATVTSPGSVTATPPPAGDTDTVTHVLLPGPIVVNQPSFVVTDTVNEPATPADFTITPFNKATLTDTNPLQLDSATIGVSGPVPYTLALPTLQDLSASALAAALDQVALTFTAPTAIANSSLVLYSGAASQSFTFTH